MYCVCFFKAPIAQSHTHSILDKTPSLGRDGSSGGGSGRTSPLGAVAEQQQQRKINGSGAASVGSGDEAGVSSRVAQATSGVAVGAGGSSNGPSAASTSGDRGGPVDQNQWGGGSTRESALGAAGRYNKSQFSVTHHRDDYGNGMPGGGGGGGGADGGSGDLVGAMGTLSLGPGGGGGSKSLQYGGGNSSRSDPYGGSGGSNNSSSHHMLDGVGAAARGGGGGAGGIGLHAGGMMPPSPYSGAQMSPYGGAQQVPQAALMGGMPPLTPELHSGSLMGYQLVRAVQWRKNFWGGGGTKDGTWSEKWAQFFFFCSSSSIGISLYDDGE